MSGCRPCSKVGGNRISSCNLPAPGEWSHSSDLDSARDTACQIVKDDRLLRSEDWEVLREVCQDDEEFFQLQTGLLDIEREFRGMARRSGIYEALEDRLRVGQFGSEGEALAIRQEEERRREEAVCTDEPHGPPAPARQRELFVEAET